MQTAKRHAASFLTVMICDLIAAIGIRDIDLDHDKVRLILEG